MLKRIMIAVMILLISSICTAKDKKEEKKTGWERFTEAVTPNEFSLQSDLRPSNGKHYGGWYIGEITGGLKWKLK